MITQQRVQLVDPECNGTVCVGTVAAAAYGSHTLQVKIISHYLVHVFIHCAKFLMLACDFTLWW